MTRIKVCGITRPSDLDLVTSLGVDAIGIVLEAASPRTVPEHAVVGLLERVPPFVAKVAVFGRTTVDRDLSMFDFVQSVEWPVEVAPPRLQSLRIRHDTQPDQLLSLVDPEAAAVLVEAHSEEAFGGTGKIPDWDIVASFAEACSKPLILAGGLTPDNVGEAIRRVRPYAVDVSSGVEAQPGAKDPIKLRKFVEAVRGEKVRER